ncbi:MAG: hypothetical protein RLZZ486_435 [Actinomycetota bacterium]
MGRITRVLFPGVKRRSPKIWVKIQIFRGILLRYLSITEILSLFADYLADEFAVGWNLFASSDVTISHLTARPDSYLA